MNTFMAIMSQLFWGVTVGALEAAFSTILRGGLTVGLIGGLGWWGVKKRRSRRIGAGDNAGTDKAD
ncbi:hypothetical protein I5E68_04470 [Novosphingobium sp. YJ-S2-02]|uniref:Uncharacterized protein n=1 Tax=Novosphingobium aureum TaxID=2792964 RepID=A0A931MJV4_9SPHN|nr:hypothetical protein [Novosphingobium aureum]MBH0112207.1 hypothetical protein [Novosphingobium aureum]